MSHPLRKCLAIGVATITATAITFVPSVREPAPVTPPQALVQTTSPPIKLAATVQPFVAVTDLPNLLVDWLQRLAVPPSAGQPFPTPEFPPVVGGTSIDSTIKNIYNAVEPWVQYGFELATYAVGWVPYVGWLSGQIMIFYNFGERIARSITFNIADWLGGNVSFVQGLINVGVDTVNSFIQLGIDELNFWLPSLPPLPPIFPFSTAAATTEVTAAAATEDVTINEKPSAVAGEVLGEEATDEATVKPRKTSEVDKKVTTTDVAVKDEVRGAQAEKSTESKKGANGATGKKADRAPGSSANDDNGAKAGKKDDTGKKDKE